MSNLTKLSVSLPPIFRFTWQGEKDPKDQDVYKTNRFRHMINLNNDKRYHNKGKSPYWCCYFPK